jgi:hypothetical protein
MRSNLVEPAGFYADGRGRESHRHAFDDGWLACSPTAPSACHDLVERRREQPFPVSTLRALAECLGRRAHLPRVGGFQIDEADAARAMRGDFTRSDPANRACAGRAPCRLQVVTVRRLRMGARSRPISGNAFQRFTLDGSLKFAMVANSTLYSSPFRRSTLRI